MWFVIGLSVFAVLTLGATIWRGRGYVTVVSDEHLHELVGALGPLKSRVVLDRDEPAHLLSQGGIALTWTATTREDGVRNHIAISNMNGLNAMASLLWLISMMLDRLGIAGADVTAFTLDSPVVHVRFQTDKEWLQADARPIQDVEALRERGLQARDELLSRFVHGDPDLPS